MPGHHYTPMYQRLIRLCHAIGLPEWKHKIERIKHELQANHHNPVAAQTAIKSFCDELSAYSENLTDESTKKLIADFLAGIGLKEEFENIERRRDTTDKEKKEKAHALKELWHSERVQNFLAEQFAFFAKEQQTNANSRGHRGMPNSQKEQILDRLMQERNQHFLNDMASLENQVSYDATGRLVKRIMDLFTLVLDAILVNLGYEPAFTDLKQQGHGHMRSSGTHFPPPPMIPPVR